MTPLTLAMRNELARDPEMRALLGSSPKWDTWIFVDQPEVKIENTQKCLIVLDVYEPWASQNLHNTMEFPTVIVDVWADPTRNPDNSVKVDDAELKIDRINKVLKKHFHTANLSRPGGGFLQWGTQEQIDSGTGVWVNGSHTLDGPRYSEVANVPGVSVASYRFAVNLIS